VKLLRVCPGQAATKLKIDNLNPPCLPACSQEEVILAAFRNI